jgi:hypothetical protein
MRDVTLGLILATTLIFHATAQTAADGNFWLALPDHPGKLTWSAQDFTIIQSSAKPGGVEIGLRGKDRTGRLTFLGFLFLFSDQAPLTSTKCRDGVMEPAKKSNSTLNILSTSEKSPAGSPPVSVVSYVAQGDKRKPVYSVRGFVATGNICGDLEIYSDSAIGADDEVVNKILASYRFDEQYTPRFVDVVLYAQVLYKSRMYKAAAPIFESALVKIKEDPEAAGKLMHGERTARQVIIDQAGMSYGMSGDAAKARSLFEKAIIEDPDYPLYYYNLACADAEEKNLSGARAHLQQAYDRKANMIQGEAMPDPTKDDSFLPYRNNKEFWAFLEGLRTKQ